MKGRDSTQAVLAVCAVLLLAGCGGGKSIEDSEVTAVDVLIDDQSRSFDTGLPELPPVTGKDVIDVSTETVELRTDDTTDTTDVCIPDCADKECGDDGCGGSCGQCDDGDVCNGVESCEAGLCDAGTILDCDDDNPCTLDECNAQAGCQHTEQDGPCDDGNPCTDGETCTTGVCTGGTKVVCDDNNPCTTDACSTVEGCITVPNNLPCNDGDPCTGNDQCIGGICQPGENACFPCESDLDCLQYDDGSLCNGLVVCDEGLCQVLEDSAVICEQPANECLNAECDQESGECIESPLPDLTFCDDGDLCTVDDVCKQGVCLGKTNTCNDGSACTKDWCDELTGICQHQGPNCDDGNQCTDDSCQVNSDGNPMCVYVVDDSNMCDDGFAQTSNVCSSGECLCLSPECVTVCGDGVCGVWESCVDCPEDCLSCEMMCDPPCGQYEECVQTTTGHWACTSVMVEVPEGTFWMGDPDKDDGIPWAYDAHPYHLVYLSSYFIDKTEVTAGQLAACLAADGACGPTPALGPEYLCNEEVPTRFEHPASCVTYQLGKDYCEWFEKQLCTEAQWEKGARGGCELNGGAGGCEEESRVYPWGNQFQNCEFAADYECAPGETEPVCSKSPLGDSPYGLCDMAGSAPEWVADWYDENYYCKFEDWIDGYCSDNATWPGWPGPWTDPMGPDEGEYKVARGGSLHGIGGYDFAVWSRLPKKKSWLDYSGSPFILDEPLQGVRCCTP
jgi:formylglycine-generating enzyme required for sulfatase activity